MNTPSTAVPKAVMALRELALSAGHAAALRAGVLLGLPDVIGAQPESVDSLAVTVKAHPATLHRLLRALVCHGVFAETDDGRFEHTEGSRLLRKDNPRSIRDIVLWGTEPWTWELWPHLETAVRTGKDVFTDLHGQDFFTHLHAERPESAKVFDRAMTQSSKLSALAIANLIDLEGVSTVADIAGGQGLVLATLLEKYPSLQGTLLDLPEVVANADPRLVSGPLANRARLAPGNCLLDIPVRADVYIFKNILEWDDASTITALRNAVKAAPPGARVIVIENLVDGSPELGFTTAMDLLLLLNVGGKKHTQDGLVTLIEKSGLQINEVKPLNSYLHMVDAVVR